MLILDFSQIMVANMYALFGQLKTADLEKDLLKHMVLNTVRSIRKKFGPEYGEIVIACDGRSWRREVYPYYKANRDKSRSKSELDWGKVFEMFGEFKTDLKQYFPYRVIEVSNAEADDVIGTLVMEFGSEGLMVGEEVLIISGDHDYQQLHRYANVRQYDPVKKKYITTGGSADDFLKEHIIKGDSGDGIPNILSDDDVFMIPGKRQKPMTKPRLEKLKDGLDMDGVTLSEESQIYRNYLRNEKLIDLRNTPDEIRKTILAEYDAQAGKDRSKIFNYLIQNRMKNLLEAVSDF